MTNFLDNSKQLLQELGHALGLESLTLDDSNTARLVFDDTMTVDFEADPDAPYLHAYSVLSPLPNDHSKRGHLLEGLLSECLVMPGELPARIVVDRSIGQILLAMPISVAETDFEPFERKIGALVNLTEEWMTRLQRGEFGGEKSSSASSETSASGDPGRGSLAI